MKRATSTTILVLLLSCAALSLAQQGGTKNPVTQMPGIDHVDDSIYAGYVSVLPQGDMSNALFYYFAESRSNPSTDPLGNSTVIRNFNTTKKKFKN